MSETLAVRLTDGYCEHTHGGYLCPDCRRKAAAVVEAAEAFQAAEREYREALREATKDFDEATTDVQGRYVAAYEVRMAAKARLLEVNCC